MSQPAGATLNAVVAHSAASDVAGMMTQSPGSSYTLRSTTLSNGTVVNEYVSSDGVVFGITWRGERIPDLPGLLGTYFPQYLQGLKAQREARGGRGPVNVQDVGLVVISEGQMRSFAGKAYLPDKLPAGVSGSDIQ
jgi:hypothetical protein